METFQYAKERRRFGRQCLFSEQNKVLDSMMSDPAAGKSYILRDPVHTSTQLSRQFALNEMNTENPDYLSKGIYHFEGGWPKDVNMLDEEATLRYRKKIERDDNYPLQMNHLLEPTIHMINTNNAVNLFEDYFEKLDPIPPRQTLSGRTVQCFRFPSESEKSHANHISFSPEGGTDMVVAYSRTRYQEKQLDIPNSYIWKIDNPQVPLAQLNCDAAATTIEYNFRDGRVLGGGLINGKVCIWDSRNGGDPTLITEKEESHRTRVNSLLWLHSKSNSEFYSGSSDGQIFFWDTRKFTTPIDSLMCDPVKTETQELHRSFGVSVLEFEPTIPTKYLVGTEEGWVFIGNRKGNTVAEKLPFRMGGNDGPIRSLERNPTFVKNFMTVGEHRIKIFSDECRDNPIIWTRNQEFELTCGVWSRTRASLLFTGRVDGVVDLWDMLVDLRFPIVTIKVSMYPICHMRAHENGFWLACGDTNGDVFMVEISDALTSSDRNDRAMMSAIFDREVKREKILEAKVREIKLKEKLEADERARLEAMTAKEKKSMEEAAKTASGSLTGSKSGVATGSKTGDATGSKTGDATGSKTGGGSGSKTGVGSGSKSTRSSMGAVEPEEFAAEVRLTKKAFFDMITEEQKKRDEKNPKPQFIKD